MSYFYNPSQYNNGIPIVTNNTSSSYQYPGTNGLSGSGQSYFSGYNPPYSDGYNGANSPVAYNGNPYAVALPYDQRFGGQAASMYQSPTQLPQAQRMPQAPIWDQSQIQAIAPMQYDNLNSVPDCLNEVAAFDYLNQDIPSGKGNKIWQLLSNDSKTITNDQIQKVANAAHPVDINGNPLPPEAVKAAKYLVQHPDILHKWNASDGNDGDSALDWNEVNNLSKDNFKDYTQMSNHDVLGYVKDNWGKFSNAAGKGNSDQLSQADLQAVIADQKLNGSSTGHTEQDRYVALYLLNHNKGALFGLGDQANEGYTKKGADFHRGADNIMNWEDMLDVYGDNTEDQLIDRMKHYDN